MASNEKKTKSKPVGMMILTGIISIGLYVALLMSQDLLNTNFSKGGLYALLPIATAFLFSFIHGNFTGNFWTVIGVEAARKKLEVK
jgi:F0F1-type ATP synthase assembly protein I